MKGIDEQQPINAQSISWQCTSHQSSPSSFMLRFSEIYINGMEYSPGETKTGHLKK